MLQTAETLNEEQYLKLADQQISKGASHFAENSDGDFRYDQITIEIFGKVSPFYYRNRLRLLFSVSGENKPDFIMIRGLIEFYRSKDFLFNYNLKQLTIETDIDASQLNELKLFLSRVAVWLKQEKQFRMALKIALNFENRYKLESESIYSIMKNTTAAARKG